MIKLPLYFEKIVFQHENYNIDVKILDKNIEIYQRRNTYDLQLTHDIKLQDLYRNHNFMITLPDNTARNIYWKKEYISKNSKEFFVYNLGLLDENNKRGKLFIKLNIILPEILTTNILTDEEKKESETLEWKYDIEKDIKRSKILSLKEYL